ncbi:beta-galactosidase [Oryzobacter sp. R7]|uniref:beta-galactosidase n=1 Tax=Oryzobacter faecalis TaxID=3388656 RepID=UPI00398D6701
MIELTRKQVVIDGTPRIVMAGEVHYFRVAREEWEQRLDLVVEAGLTAVASYIPWVYHELPDGTIDVSGTTRPERDVAAFVDLCADRGLMFIARPGPFVMAELKNEGIPFRVYREHPEIVPGGWDGVPTPSRTVDYLAPAFLEETRRWYEAILPVLVPRLQPNGGNVVMVQLDNEVGMLAWVTNSPDLTDHLLEHFARWVDVKYGAARPYPAAPGGDGWAEVVRSPSEEWAGPLRVDLGEFMRERFADYVVALRTMAEDLGVRGVPFAINIHGTEGGSGTPFPIGISQLVRTYSGIPGMVSGSDHYMGEATLTTMSDLYVINAFMDAVHDDDQPLTSLEFEAGSGDYGAGAEMQYDPSTAELKTRLCLAQGNRLVNYYLFAGGINPPLDEVVDDGNDRLSFTGERHGTAAPVGPEGQRGFAYAATARTVHAVTANEPWLAVMDEEHDEVELGLVLDAYATEYHHPASALMTDAVTDLTQHRGAGQRRALVRSLLLGGYRFGAVHLEERSPRAGSVLVLGAGRYLAADVQRRVVAHAEAGGRVLLLGPVPERDLDGSPCHVLADALDLGHGEVVRDSGHYYPSVVAHGWAAPWPETRVGWRQELRPTRGDVVLTDVYGTACGVDVPLGDGRVVLLAAELPSSRELFTRALTALGATAGVSTSTPFPGVITTTTASADGQRALHLINVSGAALPTTVTLDGEELFDGAALQVPPRSGFVLPLGLDVAGVRLLGGTGEVAGVEDGAIRFRPFLGLDDGPGHVDIAPGTVVLPGDGYEVTPFPDGTVRVTPLDAAAELVVRVDTRSPLVDPNPEPGPELVIEASQRA